jgi:hypothetical protein
MKENNMWTTHRDLTDQEMINNFRTWWNDRYYLGKPSSFVFQVLRNYIKNMRTRQRWKKNNTRLENR